MRYAVVIEQGKKNYSAYVPDLPGCVAAGDSVKEVQELIQGAIELHLEGMLLNGEPVPRPSSLCCYVEVETAQVRNQTQKRKRSVS
jgi:predicted RNase H-like HicB family nuclease